MKKALSCLAALAVLLLAAGASTGAWESARCRAFVARLDTGRVLSEIVCDGYEGWIHGWVAGGRGWQHRLPGRPIALGFDGRSLLLNVGRVDDNRDGTTQRLDPWTGRTSPAVGRFHGLAFSPRIAATPHLILHQRGPFVVAEDPAWGRKLWKRPLQLGTGFDTTTAVEPAPDVLLVGTDRGVARLSMRDGRTLWVCPRMRMPIIGTLSVGRDGLLYYVNYD